MDNVFNGIEAQTGRNDEIREYFKELGVPQYDLPGASHTKVMLLPDGRIVEDCNSPTSDTVHTDCVVTRKTVVKKERHYDYATLYEGKGYRKYVESYSLAHKDLYRFVAAIRKFAKGKPIM